MNTSKIISFLSNMTNALLLLFLLLLPFNLVFGRIFSTLVSLPLYSIDILLLGLGIVLLIRFFRTEVYLEKHQKYVFFFVSCFGLLGIFSLLQHWNPISLFLSKNNEQTILYDLFKQIISSDPLHGINKLFHLFLTIVIFVGVCISDFKRKRILQILCIPLIFIIITNIYLVAMQQDVQLDGGKPGTLIQPYRIVEIGRIYFPFVNSLLLSMYLSLLFFVVLFLFFNELSQEKKNKNYWQYIWPIILFLVVLTLGFTKGRAALLIMFILFLLLNTYLFIRKLVLPFPKLFSSVLGFFIFLTLISTFFTFPSLDNIIESKNQETNSDSDQETNSGSEVFVLREADVDATNVGRISLHWPTAIALFQSEPLFGVGTGMFFFSVVSGKIDVLCLEKELCPNFIQQTDISSTAHSIYLQTLAENGIIGFVLFIALLGIILCYGSRNLQQDISSVFLIFALVCFLLQGVLFSYFEYAEMNYLFWIFVGLLLKKE